MATLADVKSRVRSLVGDPDGDFTTDDYLIPLINQVYEQGVGMLLDASCNPFEEKVLDLPNQVAGVTNFIDALGQGKPWEGLDNPLFIEVKTAGDPVESYREVPLVARLPNVSPISSLQPGILAGGRVGAVEWRGDELYVTPFTYPTDWRLRGDFRPSALLKDTDKVKVRWEMGSYLAYSTAALVGAEREHETWVSTYGGEASLVLDRIASKLTKGVQGTRFKFGRRKRRSRLLW